MPDDDRDFIERANSVAEKVHGEPMTTEEIANNFGLFGLQRRTAALEKFDTELRVEAFNLFNHPNFNNPGSDAASNTNLLGSGVLGLIDSTVGRPDGTTSARQMQVALKLNF